MNRLPSVISVEDDPDLFNLIRASLRKLPIELHYAATGKACIELMKEVDASLIILDIMLPDMHGWDVLKHIKGMDHNLKGVIVLTARTEAPHRVIGRLQDVTAYIPKPFNPFALQDQVLSALGLPRRANGSTPRNRPDV